MFSNIYEINQKNNEKNSKVKLNIAKETYLQKEFLGSGSFGTVFLIESILSHIYYVCKHINLDGLTKEEEKKALSEVSVLKKCNHPNIINFKEAFITKNPKRRLHLITEYATEGDLGKKLIRQKEKKEYFSEKQIIYWLVQVCLALKYIHKLHVIHRDIKPSNIFLTKNGIIKIGDFGISKILIKNVKNTNTQIGTPNYMPPEVINSESYDYTVDIWSLGITFFELMTFNVPFKGNTDIGLFANIINGKKNTSINNNNGYYYSNELINIINKMIKKNPSERPTINEILNVPIINHYLKEFLKINKDLYKNINLDLNDSYNEINYKRKKNKSMDGIKQYLDTIKEENENENGRKYVNSLISDEENNALDKLFKTNEFNNNNKLNITNQKQLNFANTNPIPNDY